MSGAVTAVAVGVGVDAAVDVVLADAVAGVVGEGLVADAITGAIAGSLSSAIQGGDPLKGAIGGAVGAGVSGYAQELGTEAGNIAKNLNLGDTAQAAASGFTKGAIIGTSKGIATGQDIGDALKGGAISGGVGAISNAFYPTSKNDPWSKKLASAGANAAVRYGLQDLFGTGSSGVGATSYDPNLGITRANVSGGGKVGSSALAQSLNTGDKTDISGSDVSKKARNVWNQSSLKTSDEIGSSNG